MAYSKSLDEVTQYLVDLLEANQVALGLTTVFYGSQHIVTGFPLVVVDPQITRKERHATGNVFLYTFLVYLYVVHGKMTESRSARTKENIEQAEAVTNLIEQDYGAGGLLIDNFVEAEEPVYGIISGASVGSMVCATRLTWRGLSEAR